jgi:two-component system CheB/CheR fusion protein
MQDAGLNFPIHIFGTDISERSIEKARAGIFGPSSLTAVSPERLKRFFVEVEAGNQIARPVRDRCVFALQNLAADPPFSRMDLISCRNLLIYLGQALQQHVISTLFYALRPNGRLLLGSTETPGSFAEYFTPFDSRHRIYNRNPAADRHGFEWPSRVATFPVFKPGENPPAWGSKIPEGGPLSPLQKQVDRLLLAQYAPPSVVIDDNSADRWGRTSPRTRAKPIWICSACFARTSDCICERQLKRRGKKTWASGWKVSRSPMAGRPSQSPLRHY